MSSNEFDPNKPRPTATDDRPTGYRFYDEETSDNFPLMTAAPFSLQNQPGQDQHAPTPAKDERELDQLSMGYKIFAGVGALFSCMFFVHVFMGISVLRTGSFGDPQNVMDPEIGWFFIGFGLVGLTLGWAGAACNYLAGKYLKERRRYTFCFVMSCLNCLSLPLGTILGIFSLIILNRDSVKALFGRPVVK